MQQERQDSQTIRIAQITDTHLYAAADGRLLGLDTRTCLDRVMELARRRGEFDLLVATGDLAHDGSEAAYRAVRERLGVLGCPVYCLPGNHDEANAIRAHLNGDGFHCTRSTPAGNWQMLFLDSSVPGQDGGHLNAEELDALEQALQAHPGRPALVWLHHQPLPMGSRWLDTMAVDNGEALFACIDRHPQVRAVVWGHVHQPFDRQRNGVRLLATPSTCLQFLPGSEDFAVEEVPPGYRWLELHPDGRLDTGVERLADMPGQLDLSARGY